MEGRISKWRRYTSKMCKRKWKAVDRGVNPEPVPNNREPIFLGYLGENRLSGPGRFEAENES
jgi:hypothetical protein